ncbi:hypothetical protein GCM10027061_21960 [Nesterenkonia suensis]
MVTWLAAAALVSGCAGGEEPTDLEVTDAGHGGHSDELGELEVTVGDEAHRIAPTEVRCSGSPEETHHLIATTEGHAPRAEVAGDHFVLVRLAQDERSHETTSSEGIDLSDGQVTFEAADVGDAVVHGTLHCGTWEQ